jgi:hypothetical protein
MSVNGPIFQRFPTWVWESGFAFAWIGGVTLYTTEWATVGLRGAVVAILTAMAVLVTFNYVTVATRLGERQASSPSPGVECLPKLHTYFVGKEILWVLVFTLQGSWGALAGVPLFLLYPAWRRVYLGWRKA